uniref:Gelsolin-like domain-containing protein n=1 Tax=Timema genevievae TaxID=629358 RepID=A0A7R9JR95_TIMGE|nr:unnamed protein product [Timema genevievae]
MWDILAGAILLLFLFLAWHKRCASLEGPSGENRRSGCEQEDDTGDDISQRLGVVQGLKNRSKTTIHPHIAPQSNQFDVELKNYISLDKNAVEASFESSHNLTILSKAKLEVLNPEVPQSQSPNVFRVIDDEVLTDSSSGGDLLIKPRQAPRTTNPFLEELRSRQAKLNERLSNEQPGAALRGQSTHELQDVSEQDRDGSILADRLEKLDQARQGWKKRVEPTDAVKFSVAGKMGLENKVDTPPLATFSPADRKKRTPKQRRFRSSLSQRQEVASTPSSPQKELTPSFIRSISAPGGDENDLSSVGREAACNGMKVQVPRADDETFTAFFRSISSEHQVQQECVEIKDEDLDHVISKSSQLLVYKRNVKIHRRHAGTRNPIKALASRTDIQDEYMEIQTGLAEKELRRIQVEKLSKNCNFAVEALAGLASKEDFTAVALKKASPSSAIMLPYKDVMLLHVKGRRHVQTRLVEPSVASVNRGDSYVLVAPGQVYHWVGKYSNVIERSRGAEVALHIQQKKDLGCSGASSVITLGEEKTAGFNSSHSANFWRLLGGDESSKAVEAGHPDEDELYESCLIDTNMVFEVVNDELVPVEEYWGTIPKIKMLDPSKILVFDYGSELYVWSGKTAPLGQRRVAKRLAQELWEDGYDYSDCDVCPLSVTELLGANRTGSTVSKQSSTRPPWALLAKVTQHMETILFREKFLDWPDFTRVIRIKGCDDEDKQTDAGMDLKPCDAKLMLEPNLTEPDMELEGNHLGRGTKYFDEETHRHYEITTQSVTMWHILEFEYTQLPQISLGQFHSGDSYVVRWRYVVTVTGRELNGQPSRHSAVGRDRCAYFCWQGSDASLNEQGAAALLTVELDEELGPQVRVVQGAEHPVFLHLFQGSMVIHSGKREGSDPYQRKGWRLYICQGTDKVEAALVQVQCSGRSLRSRSSLVLVNSSRGTVFVWHGAKTCAHTKKIAMSSAEQLKKRPIEMEFPSEVDIVISELNEGSESKDFFKALGGNNRHLYVSLRHERRSYTHTPRMFHLGSLSGTFIATEVLCPHRKTEIPVPYPFLQADLYSASQPALFLLDNHHELWLWQGWWPAHNEESDGDNKNLRGSRAVLWQAERRAAMQTALDYWGLKHGNSRPRAYLVWAGLEPLAFTNLFPIWSDRDDIAELNISDGKKPGELLSVEAELARLTRSTYPAAQLLQRPLPDGVDPTRLEFYLDPNHFQLANAPVVLRSTAEDGEIEVRISVG